MAKAENEFVGYGFVDSVSIPDQANSYHRIDIVLDLISAEAVNSGNGYARDVDDLSIVRIMTTEGRLEGLFGVEKITEGAWLKVVFGNCPGNPPAWILGARDDYLGKVRRTNVISLKPITQQQRTPHSDRLASLIKLCSPMQFKSASTIAHQKTIAQSPTPYHLRVVDVGQASFCAIHTRRSRASSIVGYFDVGGPAFFHHRSFPSAFAEISRIPKDGFVALSHWDFDHYSLAVTRLKALQDLRWFAPNQAVGPNAARLQSMLGSNLTLLSASSFTILPGLVLHRGTGSPTDRNNSGFVLAASIAGGNALLAGDVSYDSIPAPARNNLVGLNISHHGGITTGTPPPPSLSKSIAAVSYGVPNRYRHPNAHSLAEHKKLGWNVIPTYPLTAPRGDVWLG